MRDSEKRIASKAYSDTDLGASRRAREQYTPLPNVIETQVSCVISAAKSYALGRSSGITGH
jgi:hypothetical protein